MTNLIPDPLLRFVTAPYRCTLLHSQGETLVESNSQTLIADLLKNTPRLQCVRNFRIIVDDSVTEDGTELTHVDSDHLSTLLRGTTTILVLDRETHELLAFLAPEVSSDELLTRLLPAVLIPNPANGITNA